MKHIEVSRKISLEKEVTADELKQALVDYLSKTIEIEQVSGGVDRFTLSGTTGAPASMTRHARLDLDISVDFDAPEKTARIIISGYARTARSLGLLYSILFLFLLIIGLLPGSIETSTETSGPIDALIFLILGIFIVIDIGRKLGEPREYLETALASLDTTFG